MSRLLAAQELQPHKVRCYLQPRDPDFGAKRIELLQVYQQVEYILENEELKPLCDVYLSYNEKPGIQAIENTAEDVTPVPGKHKTIERDPE
ncbi:hypothetical protein [Paenibacillus abyssi]|uniref:Uncharacterized protein n=1 Tax=Paenibacillus abyssi TaxID=1340531 RepID=A0A917D901_9BACL|nr:hypothetical protein [Paenibacillus abyssi]GGG13718.1 hypothetical protein GCM10010916_33310 [Paenibacillus abyssi]